MKKQYIILSAVALLTLGCTSPSPVGETNKTKDNVKTEHHESTETETATEEIQLNSGEKWNVNEEMKPHIAESEDVLKNYIDSKSTDYKGLAAKLIEINSKLVNSCTMEGQSHEELHKWLHPHMELLEQLEKAKTPKEASDLITSIQASFETFHQYFK